MKKKSLLSLKKEIKNLYKKEYKYTNITPTLRPHLSERLQKALITREINRIKESRRKDYSRRYKTGVYRRGARKRLSQINKWKRFYIKHHKWKV